MCCTPCQVSLPPTLACFSSTNYRELCAGVRLVNCIYCTPPVPAAPPPKWLSLWHSGMWCGHDDSTMLSSVATTSTYYYCCTFYGWGNHEATLSLSQPTSTSVSSLHPGDVSHMLRLPIFMCFYALEADSLSPLSSQYRARLRLLYYPPPDLHQILRHVTPHLLPMNEVLHLLGVFSSRFAVFLFFNL